jgi:hypothetical protein
MKKYNKSISVLDKLVKEHKKNIEKAHSDFLRGSITLEKYLKIEANNKPYIDDYDSAINKLFERQ